MYPLAAPPVSEGLQLGFDFTAPAGTETWKCMIGPLPIHDTTAVHAVHSLNSSAVHHMDLMVLAYSGAPTTPGVHDCAELYRAYPKLMEETILYAGQAAEQSFTFPQGVAALVPAGLTTMYEVHFLNATPSDRRVESRLNVYTMPVEGVKKSVWGGAVRDLSIDIPPGADDHVEWTRCVMTEDIDLLFVSTHTHQLGFKTTVSRFDGSKVQEEIYSNLDWRSPTPRDFTSAPLHVPAGQGFEFACHYRNPTDTAVNWGFLAKDEMCNLALVFTPGDPSIHCKFVETNDGKMVVEGSGLGQ